MKIINESLKYKKLFCFICFICFIFLSQLCSAQIKVLSDDNVVIGDNTAQEPSAKLTINSNTQGFLTPRVSDEQRIDIEEPAQGLLVYVTDSIFTNVDVTGGYCEIVLQLIKAINSVGYEVEISESGHEDCLKGSTASIPGYFITSEVKVVRVYGDNCNGQDENFSVFQHLNCF